MDVEDDIETEESFIYLGVELNAKITEEVEIKYSIFQSKTVYRTSKIKIYNSIIRPIVCYGCNTRVMTENIKRRSV